MTRFSALSLFAKALGGHRDWPAQWPDAAPKPAYDAIIVGGGGHGLGAAYYLAKKYGITNVAVRQSLPFDAGCPAGDSCVQRQLECADGGAWAQPDSPDCRSRRTIFHSA